MAWYWLRSFFRSHWTLNDYPVSVRHQAEADADADAGRTTPRFVASVDGLFVIGFGETATAARADLEAKFAEFRKENPLPRPGVQQPIRFASSSAVDAFGELRDDFIHRVLRLEWAFISDGSSLDDFEDAADEHSDRIRLLYGVDVDALPDRRIVTILAAIRGW
jgi:hypothetical protein